MKQRKTCKNTLIVFLIVIHVFLFDFQFAVSRNRDFNKVRFEAPNQNYPKHRVSKIEYQSHSPIIINGNDHFIAQATSEGWQGDGSVLNPYIIKGFNITGSEPLIYINHTDVYFQITECILFGSDTYGVFLDNVKNAIVTHNVIRNNDDGIFFLNVTDGIISNNLIYSNIDDGIGILWGQDIIISNNTVFENQGVGIRGQSGYRIWFSENEVFNNTSHGMYLSSSTENILSENQIHHNLWHGIQLKELNKSVLSHNLIHNNSDGGIRYVESENNLIQHNFVYDNINYGCRGTLVWNTTFDENFFSRSKWEGIELLYSQNNTMSSNHFSDLSTGISIHSTNTTNVLNNTIYDCKNGITLEAAVDNILQSNTIFNNSNYGIYISNYYSSTFNNSLQWNNLISNNVGGVSQAYDEGMLNSFKSNYWSDWTSPDGDSNGYVDTPYSLEGAALNQDSFPLVSRHQQSGTKIIYPNGGETLTASVTIQWTLATNSHGHQISHEVWCSSDNGITWRRLITGLTNTSYYWNTASVTNSSNYLIKVKSMCSEGLISSDISDSSFIIKNPTQYPTTTTTTTTSETKIIPTEPSTTISEFTTTNIESVVSPSEFTTVPSLTYFSFNWMVLGFILLSLVAKKRNWF